MHIRLFAIMSIALVASAVQAAQVYQWVDEQGTTQFSDTPPFTKDSDVSMLTYEAPPAAIDPADDYWSVTNQLERMDAARLAEAQARAASRPQQVTRITYVTAPPEPPQSRHRFIYSPAPGIYPGRSHRHHGYRDQRLRQGFSARYSTGGFSIRLNNTHRAGRLHRM
jgi:hypothetical protein